jgi:RNA polymerase primary sigma factor
MDDAMQVLTPRERQGLRLRHGLTEDGREHTLAELGEMLGVSPERVRQVESAALYKLRKPGMRRRLRDYLDEYTAR